MSDYYKSLYLKNYVPADEIQERIDNAVNFSILVSTQPELLSPVWDWYLNFYFNGIDENAQTSAFIEDIKRFAKSGFKIIPLVLHEAEKNVAMSSPLGMICDIWTPQEGLDEQEREYVINILKNIKLKTQLWCNEVNWDYFIDNCWKELFSSVFEYYYGTGYERANNNIINEKINKILKNEGLEFCYIKQISAVDKMSCFGVDMSCAFSSGPAVLKFS